MRDTYDIIHKIASSSGLKYTLEKGTDVGPESEHVWSEIVRVSPSFCELLSFAYGEYRSTRAQPNSSTKDGNTTIRCCSWCCRGARGITRTLHSRSLRCLRPFHVQAPPPLRRLLPLQLWLHSHQIYRCLLLLQLRLHPRQIYRHHLLIGHPPLTPFHRHHPLAHHPVCYRRPFLRHISAHLQARSCRPQASQPA